MFGIKNRGTALIVGILLLVAQTSCGVLKFSNAYYSPRNRERSIRKSTSLIVLHTTEAPSRSALRKLRDLGECHYCISELGYVYRIIDRRREAYHAGRSMWNGRTNVDSFSVGIEVCGYHNKPLKTAQYRALADLVAELKAIYRIPDHRVVTHSHVAYGTPNKWHPRSHRGRKRCGMQFAMPQVRRVLRLKTRPAYDPDVKAHRLVVGDRYLSQVLYGVTRGIRVPPASGRSAAKGGKSEKQAKSSSPTAFIKESNVVAAGHSAWDIARDAYKSPSTLYRFPNGTVKRGNQIRDFKLIPPGTRIEVAASSDNQPDTYHTIGIHGKAQDIAGSEVFHSTTIFIYPDGKFYRGNKLKATEILKLPYGTKVLVGYRVGGPITISRPASSFCGERWKSGDTFFLMHGELVPGNKVDDSKIQAGTYLFYKE